MNESTLNAVEAKYPGLCLSCNNRWQPGEWIHRIHRKILEGIGHCYTHAKCPPPAPKIQPEDRDGSLGTLRNRLRCFCHECRAFVDPGEGRVWLCEACASGHDEPEWHTSHRDKDLCEHYKRDEPEAAVPKTPSWAEVNERYLVLDGRKLKLEVGSTVAELRKEMARELWHRARTVDLLALDELGTEGTPEAITRLLLDRWTRGAITLCASNVSAKELHTRYFSSADGERLADRLRGQTEQGVKGVVSLRGSSRRHRGAKKDGAQ